MPAVAWFTLIVAALIIAITAIGLLRVIFHLRAIQKTLRRDHRRSPGRRQPDQHGARAAHLGQREPEACPRLLRNDLTEGATRWNPTWSSPPGHTTTGWVLGFTIGGVIVLVVVALVVPILLLARSIGNEAPKINDALTEAVHNTAPLGALRTTIEHATIIIAGLQRGRARLGG